MPRESDKNEVGEILAAPSREQCALLSLRLARNLGPIAIARLLAMFGTARAALEAAEGMAEDAADGAWADALGCAVPRAARCRASALEVDVQAELRAINDVGGRLVGLADNDYPALLKTIHDPPPLLWVRGILEPIDVWSIAIVGARRCSAYGLDQAARFAKGMAAHGHTIVSGGARGIDAEAHRAALRAGGRTIAVLGSGLGCPYPPENAPLFDAIVAGGGAVVSEQPVRTGPRPDLFPQRNRIISGWSLGVILIEARARSGASITARLAVEDHGREAMAVPGRADSPTSEGSHRAIREGWAALVTSPEEVMEQLASAGHLVRGAMERQGRGADRQPSARRVRSDQTSSEKVALPLVDQLSPLAREVAGRIVEHASTGRPARLDETIGADAAHEVLATLTTLELLGLVLRDIHGQWMPRAGLAEALKSLAAQRL